MIVVIATITCRPGTRTKFLEEFSWIIPDVLQEQGCIEYGPTVDADTGLPSQHCADNRVTIVEKWDSVADLKAHLVAPHMDAYRPKVKEFVDASELRVLEYA